MSELLLSGRNSTTNKKTVLNTDDDGKIKIDESGKLTSIDNRLFQIYGPTFAGQINLQNIDTKMNGLIDIIDNTDLLNNVVKTNDAEAGNNSLLIGGIHKTTFPTLDDGDASQIHLSSEGNIITQQRCNTSTMIDGVSNTNKELPKSCSGGYISTPVLPYVYNGSTWDRMRGSTNGLKIDESGTLSNIETNTDTTNTNLLNTISAVNNVLNYNKNNDLKYLRSQGKCFTIGSQFLDKSDNYYILSLFNNGTGNKNQYIYRIRYCFDNDNTGDTKSLLQIHKITAASGGTTMTPRNLQLGSNNTSTLDIRKANPTVSKDSDYINLVYGDAPTDSTHLQTVELPEAIEISNGNGLAFYFNISPNSTAVWARGYVEVYYIELNDTVEFPQ
jgi:hypothetical protein